MPFPAPISAEMPYDVDLARKKALEDQGAFPDVQRLFDIYSWQTFIALNWPADREGNPERARKLGDKGRRVWETWKEAFEVYLPTGADPAPWGTRTVPPESGASPEDRLLRMSFKKNRAHAGVADETSQAFSGPLVDQHGKWVRYEVVMNREEFDYVVTQKFYYIEGQIEFSKSGKKVEFPSGKGVEKKRGAMELKLAWKEMDPGDIKGRFYTTSALILDAKGAWIRKEMGLVGMHIAVKTESAPTWVWATFEQVDNVDTNPVEKVVGNDGKLTAIKPSFNNADRSAAATPVNVLPPKTGTVNDACNGATPIWDEATTKTPVQVTRVIPIPADKRQLNCEVQRALKGTVFQYYQLIDTQWPTQPKPLAAAGKPGQGSAPGSVVNKSPGNVVPVFLTNTTMESYFQIGNQHAGPEEEGSPPDSTLIFGTESCTGCHYSAGIADGWTPSPGGGAVKCAQFGGAGNGDFSWLMSQKASFRDPKAAGK